MNVSLPPVLKQFVEDQVRTGRYTDAGEVIRHSLRVLEASTAASLGEGDIMAMAFIVMMEAAKSAREDLKAIMESVKAINAAKQAWREIVQKVNRDLAANDRADDVARPLDFSRGMGAEREYHRVSVPRLGPDCPGGVCFERADLYRHKIAGVADLRLILESVKNRLDSLGEMGEMESLRLQMAMDRLSKIMTTLSNLLKKSSDTAASIVQNQK